MNRYRCHRSNRQEHCYKQVPMGLGRTCRDVFCPALQQAANSVIVHSVRYITITYKQIKRQTCLFQLLPQSDVKFSRFDLDNLGKRKNKMGVTTKPMIMSSISITFCVITPIPLSSNAYLNCSPAFLILTLFLPLLPII